VDGVWAPKGEGVGLIVRAISFQYFHHMWSQSTNVTDGLTDGQTDDMRSQDRALHYSASRGNNTAGVILPIEQFKSNSVTGKDPFSML